VPSLLPNNPTGLDAYRPAQIAELIETAGVAKANLKLVPLATMAFLAGAFIAMGAAAFTMTMAGVDPTNGPTRILGGVVFSLGLVLVIVGGAELFTGNALMVMAAVDHRISVHKLLRNWFIVYLGNFVGAVVIAAAMAATGILEGKMGASAISIASAKLNLGAIELFARGALCNALVCLAVWLSIAARNISGKLLAITGPVTAFVALGLEHSIANMYLFPQAVFAGLPVGLEDFARNLLFVTLGNIFGGAGGIALSFHLAYRTGNNTLSIPDEVE